MATTPYAVTLAADGDTETIKWAAAGPLFVAIDSDSPDFGSGTLTVYIKPPGASNFVIAKVMYLDTK